MREFLGGQITDRLGAKRSIIIVLSAFIVTIILIPYLQFSLALFICALLLWNLLSWSLQPAIQSYLVSAAPETSDIQQSLNNSGVHVGMAIGSTVGGIIIDQYHVEINPLIAGASHASPCLLSWRHLSKSVYDNKKQSSKVDS